MVDDVSAELTNSASPAVSATVVERSVMAGDDGSSSAADGVIVVDDVVDNVEVVVGEVVGEVVDVIRSVVVVVVDSVVVVVVVVGVVVVVVVGVVTVVDGVDDVIICVVVDRVETPSHAASSATCCQNQQC